MGEGRAARRSPVATVTANADGRYVGANAAALELLGVTLTELLASAPGRFSAEPADPDAGDAFRRQWEASGSPDLGGQATIIRADGKRVRIRFAISQRLDGHFDAFMEPVDSPVDSPSNVTRSARSWQRGGPSSGSSRLCLPAAPSGR